MLVQLPTTQAHTHGQNGLGALVSVPYLLDTIFKPDGGLMLVFMLTTAHSHLTKAQALAQEQNFLFCLCLCFGFVYPHNLLLNMLLLWISSLPLCLRLSLYQSETQA